MQNILIPINLHNLCCLQNPAFLDAEFDLSLCRILDTLLQLVLHMCHLMITCAYVQMDNCTQHKGATCVSDCKTVANLEVFIPKSSLPAYFQQI